MKVLFLIFATLIVFVSIFAFGREWRFVTQYFNAPNGRKYKVQYSIKIERYKWWIGNIPKFRNNL